MTSRVAILIAVCALSGAAQQPYTASAGTPPRVSVRSPYTGPPPAPMPVQQPVRRGSGYGYALPAYYASYVPQYVAVPVEVPPTPLPQQPIIINQYFNTPAPPPPPTPVPPPAQVARAAARPGDLLAPPDHYYLIAYRNRAMYAAISWWMEGRTLHYVTTENTHNQVTLDLVDLEKTKKLNEDRNVPFAIDGR